MINRETKLNVFARDKYRCLKCGEASELTIDHILPVSEGGTDEVKNLQTLCLACNHRKGNNLELSFWQRIKFIWRVDVRIQSVKKTLGSQFAFELKNKASEQSVNDRFEKANRVFAKFSKELLDAKNTLNGNLTNDRKQTAVKFLGFENKMLGIDHSVEDVEKVLVELIDYLGIEYTPNGFREKE